MKVSAEYAEEHFAELVMAVDRGEEVEISRAQKPVLKLVVASATDPLLKKRPRILGAGRGEMRVPSEAEWREMDQELERIMNDAPLISSVEI